MKKIAAILLALAILAAGCGRKEAMPLENEAPESAAETEPHIPTTEEAAKHNAQIDPADVHIIQFDDPDPGDMIAVFTTTEGEFRIRLFRNHAPKTVDAFVSLVKDGYYNGQKFHAIVDGYKIETGGSIAGVDTFPEEGEFSLDLWNFRGAAALSNNGSDFLIVQANQCLNPVEELEKLNFPRAVIEKYSEVGGAPHQDWKNPVFGAVISGMDVVDKIAASKLGDDENPLEPVFITKAEIEAA